MYNEYEEKIENLKKQIEDLQYQLKQHELLAKENTFKTDQLLEENAKLRAQLSDKISFAKKPLERVEVPAFDVKVEVQQEQQAKPNAPPPAIRATTTPSPQSNPPNIPPGARVLHSAPIITQNMSTGTLKRICPNCGAMGFAIKEVEDRTQILSYVPRKIYAKKKVCTKCFLEF